MNTPRAENNNPNEEEEEEDDDTDVTSNEHANKKLESLNAQLNTLKNSTHYVHDAHRPMNNTFITKNLKGLVAHNIRAGNVNANLRVGEPLQSNTNPTRIKVVRQCKTKNKSSKKCTSCSVVEKHLRLADKDFDTKLFDPIFDADDKVECQTLHAKDVAAMQRCMIQKGCYRRGVVERGGNANANRNNQAYNRSMEPWKGLGGNSSAGAATFCCAHNELKAKKINDLEAQILKAAGAEPAATQAETLAEMKDVKTLKKADLQEIEVNEAKFIQQVAPIALAAQQNEADAVVLKVALGTINFLKIETSKRLKQAVDMIDGLEYTPGKGNKIATALAMGGAAGAGATHLTGSTGFGLASGVAGALYGYAKGSTGVIKDVIEGIKAASEKILTFIEFVLTDPRRAAFILEAFVMLKKAICSALSQAIHKEPIVVQKSMFQVMSNGATQLTDAGKFVTKRLFVEALDKVFSGGILERLTGSITQLTSLTMGPFAAAGAFLGDLASGALKDVFEIYSKQAFLTHYLNANGAALHKLIFGSCIEQPVVVEVSKEATLAAIASTMTSAQASITKAVSPVGWYKWAAQAKVSNENELKKVNQAIATANQKNRVLKPIQPQQ